MKHLPLVRFTTARFLLALSTIAALTLAACVTSPLSRTTADSTQPVTLKGLTLSAGQTITIQAVDQNTGSLVTLGSALSATTGTSYKTTTGSPYTLYPWSYSAGVLPKNYWSPQAIVPDLATAQGHLEIVVSGGNTTFDTFSPAAANSALASGLDPGDAGNQYTDGKSTVLFDQNGVGFGPEGLWTNVAGMVSPSPQPNVFSSVAWSVGYYTVDGGTKKIYALICAPKTGGPYPVVVFNHGGTGVGNGGNITGVVTAAGWTSQPYGAPDGLGQCVDWAKRGWIFATSSYRGEGISITSASPSFATGAWPSDGNVEFCMGEVTDVMALTDLVVNHASAITVGGAGGTVTLNPNGKLFMYGYSHGGCITHRAVEQGAPVSAYSVIEGFTDLRLGYLAGLAAGSPCTPPPPQKEIAAVGAGAYQPPLPGCGGTATYYLPDANGVMGYNWRSAHYFASRGDLAIQKFKTMPILILHGDIDLGNPVALAQPAEIAADLNTTNIFIGPTPPTSEPCIAGVVGAPIATLTAPNASCPITFTVMDPTDPCLTPGPPPFYELGYCKVVPIPLTPPPGQPQQQHYFVVYHNMFHTNGGLAIKYTFDRFAEVNFDRHPGCDGLEADCASD